MFDYGVTINEDVLELLLGKKLGSGVGRDVYVLQTDPSLVIKIEYASYSFQNIVEWNTWHDSEGTFLRKYLAPCKWISKCGIAMIQKRTDPLNPKKAPKNMPVVLTDFKYSNYGILNGKIVCHDYGTNLSTVHTTKRMQKVEWWEEE